MHRIVLSSCVTAAVARNSAEDVLLTHKSTNLNANAILTPDEDNAKIDGTYYANRHKMAEKRASFLEKANTVIIPEKRSGLEFEAHLKEQQHKADFWNSLDKPELRELHLLVSNPEKIQKRVLEEKKASKSGKHSPSLENLTSLIETSQHPIAAVIRRSYKALKPEVLMSTIIEKKRLMEVGGTPIGDGMRPDDY